jgi:hypothetical protein
MAAITLSQDQIQQLHAQLDAALKSSPAAAATAAAPAAPVAIDFCSAWPGAKAALQAIATLYPAAGWAIGIVIAIVDQIYNSQCKK